MPTQRMGSGTGWYVLLVPFVLMLVAIPGVFMANHLALHTFNDVADPESAAIQTGLWAAQSGHLYPSLTDIPFTPAVYGPAYYEVLRALASPRPYDFQGLVSKARLLSFLAYLLICLELSAIAWRFRISAVLCVIPAVITLTQPEAYPWTATARPDMIAMFLNVTAVLCFCWYAETSVKCTFVAGFFAGAAVVFKQSMATAGLAIGFALMLNRRWKDLLVFCLSASIVPLAVVGSLLFGREPVLDEMLLMRFNAWNLHSAIHQISSLIIFSPWCLTLIAMGTCGCFVVWRKQDLRSRVLVLYCGFAWCIGLFTMLNVGAYINHLLEGFVTFALLTAFTLNEFRLSWEGIPAPVRYIVFAYLLLPIPWQVRGCFSGYRPHDLDARVMELVRGRRVFSDVAYVASHSTDPELLDSYETTQLEVHGRWSSAAVQDQLEHQWFDLVVLKYSNGQLAEEFRGFPHLGYAIRTAIDRNYKPACILRGEELLLFVRTGETHAFENDRQVQDACDRGTSESTLKMSALRASAAKNP